MCINKSVSDAYLICSDVIPSIPGLQLFFIFFLHVFITNSENIKSNLGHKKLIICFSGTARVTFNSPRIKNFYCIPTDKCEKSSTHSELTVQSGRHLPCLWLVGWLNSGAPALAIRHHLLKVGIFTEHRRNLVFIHKR